MKAGVVRLNSRTSFCTFVDLLFCMVSHYFLPGLFLAWACSCPSDKQDRYRLHNNCTSKNVDMLGIYMTQGLC